MARLPFARGKQSQLDDLATSDENESLLLTDRGNLYSTFGKQTGSRKNSSEYDHGECSEIFYSFNGDDEFGKVEGGFTGSSNGEKKYINETGSEKRHNGDKLRQRRKKAPRSVEITSQVLTSGNYGSLDEKQPLLSSSSVAIDIPDDGNEATNTNCRQKFTNCWNSLRSALPQCGRNTLRFCSLLLFMLLFVIGWALLIGINVDTDKSAIEMKPLVFHYYTVALVLVFIFWMLWEYCRHHSYISDDSDSDSAVDPLIPIHLLLGLALFGVCNIIFQIILIVDFSKCSRNISGLDPSYVVSAVFESLFVVVQLYVFYTLSRKRKEKLWFDDCFTMLTLAINLTIWSGYFCAGVVNNPDLEDVSWLRHYHYGLHEDLCASENNTGNSSRSLHQFVKTMAPYKFSFAMEYSLLASALLLHLWLELATPKAGEFGAANKRWELWRFEFIAGLLSLPFIGCIGVYSTVKFNPKNHTASEILYSAELALFVIVLLCSAVGLCLICSHYTQARDHKPLKVDLVLLCFSFLGFLVFDSFTIFATVTELWKSYSGDKFLLGFASFVELITVVILTIFIYTSYFYQVPQQVQESKYTKAIRQICSFLLVVSFGLWAIQTYTFRSKHSFDFVGREYFGKTPWVAITHFSVPICIFYHFHCVVCLSGMIADATVAGGHVLS